MKKRLFTGLCAGYAGHTAVRTLLSCALAAVFGFCCIPVDVSAQTTTSGGISAGEIMANYREQRSSRDERSKFTMTLKDSRGRERLRKLEQATITDDEDNQKTLVTVDEPEDIKGTAFLIVEQRGSDDDQWLYLPAFRKVRRVLPNEKSDSFLGSDFYYEDMEREDLGQYEYTLKGEETIDGTSCWIVEAVPANDKIRNESGYSKRELWISKETSVGLQTRFYDKKGKPVKHFRADDIREIGENGKLRAYRLEMKNEISGHQTIISYEKYEVDKGIPDSIFTRAYLERGK